MSDTNWHTLWVMRLIRDGLIAKPQFCLMTPKRARALLASHIGLEDIEKMSGPAYKSRLKPASQISVSSSVYGVDD